MYTCQFCPDPACKKEHPSYPKKCPCLDEESVRRSEALTKSGENLKIAVASACLESNHGWDKTRLEEILLFCKSMGYRHLGVVACYGLWREAKVLNQVLCAQGFQTTVVTCKFGNIPKEKLGLTEEQKFLPYEYDPMCNPVGQALFLKECGTEFNIMLGLCVGHDTLFIKTTDTPMTVFAVKDRILCHNPLGAIYNINNFYRRFLDSDYLKKREN